jgi:hypothetical protein
VGDGYDLGSPENAFAGADAVVSAFNPGWTEPSGSAVEEV